MELILKHLDGAQQYLFLQNYLSFFLPTLSPQEMPGIIKKIMQELNKKA